MGMSFSTHMGLRMVCGFAGRLIGACLPGVACVSMAEFTAIKEALELICNSHTKTFLILTDSLSCHRQLLSLYSVHPLVLGMHQALVFIVNNSKDFLFIFVPGHASIPGNEKADAHTDLDAHQPCAVLSADALRVACQAIYGMCQSWWLETTTNKLSLKRHYTILGVFISEDIAGGRLSWPG